MDKKAMMTIVANMCAYQSASCRGLDMADMARQLLDMASVPANAKISEIPVSDYNQVVVYFYIPGDSNYYMLFAGDGMDGSKANFKLSIDGTLDNDGYVDFFDNPTKIDINYFKEDENMAKKEFNDLLKSECTKAEKLANILTGRNDAYVSAWSHSGKEDTDYSTKVECEISFRDTDDMPNFVTCIIIMLMDRRMSYACTMGPDMMQYIDRNNAKDYAGAFPLPCDVKEEETDMMGKDRIVREVLTERAIEIRKRMLEDRVTAAGAYYVIDMDTCIECDREMSSIIHGAIGLIDECAAADITESLNDTPYEVFDGKCPLYVIPDSEHEIYWKIYENAQKADTKSDLAAVYEDLARLYQKNIICRMSYKALMSALDAFWGMISTPTNELSVQDA